MLETTHRVRVSTPAGAGSLRPDELVLPVEVRVSGPTPTQALQRFQAIFERLRGCVPQGQVHAEHYRSSTAKLMGKGFRGRGVRHDVSCVCVCTLPLPAAWGFVERVLALETLREALSAFDDSDEVVVGDAQWRLVGAEAHQPELLERLGREVQAAARAFGCPVGKVEVEPLVATVVAPDRIDLSLTASWTLQAAGQPLLDSVS